MRSSPLIWIVALAWVCACSDDDEAIDLSDGFSGPLAACLAETSYSCQASPSDRPPPVCEAGCSLVGDLRLDCSGFDYGPTPRLAVIGNDTYMAARSPMGAGLFRAQGNTWTAITELPCGFEQATDDVLAARGPDGALYLLTDTHPKAALEGGATLARLEGDQWTSEAVFHVEGPVPEQAQTFAPVRELAFASASNGGSVHAWFAIPGDMVHATRAGEGEWTYANEHEDAKRWSLSPAGEPIRLLRTEPADQAEQSELPRLSAGMIGTEYDFGELEYESNMHLIAPAPESEVAQPEIVALVHQSDALHIHWVDQAGESSFAIPETKRWEFWCDENCGDGCHSGARGIRNTGYAGVRAADGRLWIGWVDIQDDGQYVGSSCEQVGDDESTATFRLARFDFATLAIEQVFEAPLLSGDGYDVEMQMHDGRLSVVWMNREHYSMRLIQLDVFE